MEETRNTLILCGTAVDEPIYSHENHNRKFYRFLFSVRRLSGQEDLIPVITTLDLLTPFLPLTGRRLQLEGELRSFNNKGSSGSRLVISVFPRTITPADGADHNLIRLSGILCKPPILRRTPLGRCICDMMLAVNRRYGRADYLPCIAWGQIAMLTGGMQIGEKLSLEGRVQSRVYTKVIDGTPLERTAYEVSIMHLTDDHNDHLFP